jgi:hypothetical protein
LGDLYHKSAYSQAYFFFEQQAFLVAFFFAAFFLVAITFHPLPFPGGVPFRL